MYADIRADRLSISFGREGLSRLRVQRQIVFARLSNNMILGLAMMPSSSSTFLPADIAAKLLRLLIQPAGNMVFSL